MTISELVELAEGGNVEAMMELGERYYNQYQEKNLPLALEKSLPWYTMAGRHGDPDGASWCVKMGSIQILMAKNDARFDQMEEYALQFAEICGEFAQNEALFDSPAGEQIVECMDVCLYASALYLYMQKNCEGAVKELEAIEQDSGYYGMAQVLMGICLSDIDRDEEGAQCLSILNGDIKSLMPPIPDRTDEEFLELGTQYYAVWLRLIELNVDAAYDLMNRVLAVVEDEAVRSLLVDELAHYKKKLFGGYKYVN